jgi:HD-like signal output (HDOD) protein
VLPHVVFKVMEISASVDSPGHELERAIVIDPGFSSKLLSLSNSAYYGLPRKVNSVRDAITFLGFKAIRNLAMTVGVFDLFVGKNDKDSLRRRRWWRHSVDTAVCCRWLADKTGLLPSDEAYTSGLLHYIGKTLLDRFGDAGYEKVELLLEHGVEDLRAEHAVYKCDHIELAVAAAQQWGFPDELVAGLEYRHPSMENADLVVRSACVALASQISEMAVAGTEDSQAQIDALPRWALDVLNLRPEEAPELLAKATQVISEAASIQL